MPQRVADRPGRTEHGGTVQYPVVIPPSGFTTDPALADVVRPGVLWWDGATVVERAPALDPLLAHAEAAVRRLPPEDSAAVRTMYKRVGIDPTKTRPSNEALLRRLRKGGQIPRVNSMVDVVNWCSVEFQLPYGLYDRLRMRGAVMLRLGREGEAYAGIRKDEVHVAGRIIVADDEGPFGNPTSDSARTMVTSATTEALVVVYAPASTDAGRLRSVLDTTSSRLALVCGGRESGRWLA